MGNLGGAIGNIGADPDADLWYRVNMWVLKYS